MSNFPLYTSVSTGILEKDLTVKQKEDFVLKTSVMDKEGHELIYALMRVFFLEHEPSSPFNVLYGGKHVNNNIVFDMDNIPLKLRQILYKFIKIHVKKIKEDEKLAKGRID